jgi:hypothetical protein
LKALNAVFAFTIFNFASWFSRYFSDVKSKSLTMAAANISLIPFPGFAIFDQYVAKVIGLVVPHMRFALNGQGLVSFDDLLVPTETNIDKIANAIRKPCGVMPIPAFNPNFPVPGVLPTLPNPGLPIGDLPVKHLKLLCYYVCHLRRTQRSFNPV